MKKLLFFLLGMLMITSASAAEYQYVPLVREGVKWEYVGYYHAWPQSGYEPVQLYTLEFKGINIRVTTYTDGTRHTEKVIR